MKIFSLRKWLSNGAALLTTLGLVVSLGLLVKIGPPPTLRIDALWVHNHRPGIKLLVGSLCVAACATVFGLVLRQRIMIHTLLWIAAVVIGFMFFSDRIPIIAQVLLEHSD